MREKDDREEIELKDILIEEDKDEDDSNLLLRSNIASGDNYKSGIKAGIYILLFALIFDMIWIYQFTGFWRHGVETSDLWKSLTFIHNSVYFIAIIELLLKFPLIYLYFKQFKNVGGSNNELLNLMYGRK